MNSCIDTTEDWRTGKVLEKKLIKENDGLPVNFHVERKKLRIKREIHKYFEQRSPVLSARLPSPRQKANAYQRPRKSMLPKINKSNNNNGEEDEEENEDEEMTLFWAIE